MSDPITNQYDRDESMDIDENSYTTDMSMCSNEGRQRVENIHLPFVQLEYYPSTPEELHSRIFNFMDEDFNRRENEIQEIIEDIQEQNNTDAKKMWCIELSQQASFNNKFSLVTTIKWRAMFKFVRWDIDRRNRDYNSEVGNLILAEENSDILITIGNIEIKRFSGLK